MSPGSADGRREGRAFGGRRPLSTWLRIAVLGLVAALAAGYAVAADGVITGSVSDSQSRPLRGVRVVVQGPRDGLERETATGPLGEFRVVGLAPGSYRVSFDREGYQWLEVRDVGVGVGREVVLAMTLAATAGDEFVLRTGGPMIDAWSTADTLSRDAAALAPLPGGGRPRPALIPGAVPGVDDRWHAPGLSILGEVWAPIRWEVDQLEPADPEGVPDGLAEAALAGWAVERAGSSLLEPSSGDGAIRLATRSPTAGLSGTAELGWSSDGLAGGEELTPSGRGPWIGVDEDRRGSLVVGGAGLGGRLGVLGSLVAGGLSEDLRLAVENASGDVVRRHRRQRDDRWLAGALRLDWRPRPSHRLDLLVLAGQRQRDGDVADLLVVGSSDLDEPGFDLDRDERSVGLRSSSALGRGGFLRAHVGGSVVESGLRPWSVAPSVQDQTLDGRFSDGVGGGAYSGGAGFPPFRDRHELLRAGLELETQHGRHLLQFGLDWRDDRARRWFEASPADPVCLPLAGAPDPRPDVASAAAAGCADGVLVDPSAARVRLRDDRGLVLVVDRSLSPRLRSREMAVSVVDRWRPRPDLGFEAGLRGSWIDLEGGAASPVGLSESPLERLDLAAGVVWDPEGRGRSRVFLRVARRHPLPVVDPDRGLLAPDVWRRLDLVVDGSGGWGVGSPGSVVAVSDPAVLTVVPRTSLPAVAEAVLGAETEILGGLAVGLSARHRQTDDDPVRIVDPATGSWWLAGGGDPLPFSGPDGGAARVPSRAYTERAIEAYARKRLGDGWQAELSVVWVDREGSAMAGRGADLERLEGPAATEPFTTGDLAAGRQPTLGDRPWQVRALASSTLATGTVVGATAWWTSGAPVERLGASVVDLRLDQRPVGDDRGRTPSIWELDLRVAQPLSLGRGELELALEVLNLFDCQAPLRGDPRWSLLDEDGAAGLDPDAQKTEEGWGGALVRQRPRRVELGLRYRW